MRLRLSEQKDIPLLAAVERSAARKFAEFREELPPETDRTLPHDTLMEAHQNKSLWLAVKADDQPSGFLAATKIDDGFHIHELSVAYESQGLGIGHDLIEALKRQATSLNIPAITLTTDRLIPWNKPFYERRGFREIAIEECAQELKAILLHDIKHARDADNRIAMIFHGS